MTIEIKTKTETTLTLKEQDVLLILQKAVSKIHEKPLKLTGITHNPLSHTFTLEVI